MLKLVPFNPAWIGHDKLDLHAIYRRPQWKDDEFGERQRVLEHGLPVWDLTGPLPVRQHNTWTAKGFEYVTLADANSLVEAAKKQTLDGPMRDYVQDPSGSPWNYRKYAKGQATAIVDALAQLRADVARFGSDAVEALRGIELPDWLKGYDAGDEIPIGPPTNVIASSSQSIIDPSAIPVAPASELTGRRTRSRKRPRVVTAAVTT